MTAALIDTNMMPAHLALLLDILRDHPGRENAISMLALYEQWSGDKLPRDPQGKPVGDVATKSREMRKCIDDLREIHGIPVMSSAGAGYWIVTSKAELGKVHHEFRSRGIKSLQTAARLMRNSLADEVQQLALDLQNDSTEISKTVKARRAKLPASDFGDLLLSPEAKMAAITVHLTTVLQSPDEYAEQIKLLQQTFGPKLIPHKVLRELRDQIRAASQAIERLAFLAGADVEKP